MSSSTPSTTLDDMAEPRKQISRASRCEALYHSLCSHHPKLMKPPGHITVLGAGLTGLSTAWRLSHLLPSTSRITLLESSDRIGGWVQSSTRQVGFRDEQGNDQEGEVILELGPRSIRPTGSKGAAGMLKLVRCSRDLNASKSG